MDRLLVVDGSNLLFQMFFGMPSRIINQEGKAIQGILGFVGALIKIINMAKPTHLAVLFDGEHENSRTKILPEYKANRADFSLTAEAENPFSQLSGIYAALDFLKIKHAEIAEVETDDVIAGYAARYGEEMEIVISSCDSDFFQLFGRNNLVLRYKGKHSVFCDSAYLQNRYGILPSQYADFKALTGDSSDNIKGAEKIGPKTAAAILCRYGSLQSILQSADQVENRRSERLSCKTRIGFATITS